jgi:excisionase family DNA binding protein
MLSLLSVPQVARMLGVSVHTIYAWAAEERIPLIKLGKRTLFDPDEIRRWVSERSIRERDPSNPTSPTGSAPARGSRTSQARESLEANA